MLFCRGVCADYDISYAERTVVQLDVTVTDTIEIGRDELVQCDVRNCENLRGVEYRDHKKVALSEVSEKALSIVNEWLPRSTDPRGDLRVPPLVICGHARSGKSTALAHIFESLKAAGMSPIIISFNGGSGFMRQEKRNETQLEALLRVIACALNPGMSDGDAKRVKCDGDALVQFLPSGVVLLIDELNVLGESLGSLGLDQEVALFLRKHFCDAAGRYVVVTSHVPLPLDGAPASSVIGSSSMGSTGSTRGCKVLPVATTTNPDEMRAMHTLCSAITPSEIALYGANPALLFSIKVRGEADPNIRYSLGAPSLKGELPNEVLRQFVAELLEGQAEMSNLVLRKFDMFSTSTAEGKIRWPLCYVERILHSIQGLWSSGEAPEGLLAIRILIGQLGYDAQKTETGFDWEAIVAIALTLACLGVKYRIRRATFVEALVGDRSVEKVLVRTLPPDVREVGRARDKISELLTTDCTLGLFTPAYSKFPIFDGFIAYRSTGGNVDLVGVQMKLGRAYPDQDVPVGVQAGFLIRGDAPEKGRGDARPGWTYLDKGSIMHVLGYSLGSLYPSCWPKA